MNYRTWLFKGAFAFSLAAAVYHLVGVFYPINSSPPWRHGVFVGVCLFCSYGFTTRPKYFVYLFAVLFVQQVFSHGQYLVTRWMDHNRVDWNSLVLLTFMPILLVGLINELSAQRK